MPRKNLKTVKDLPSDASKEWANFVLKGVQHKYAETATVFVSLKCREICPWCFRGPRIFKGQLYEHDKVADLDKTVAYLKRSKRITNVLLTGGDALTAKNLVHWLRAINKIEHIRVVRIGTRLPILKPRFLKILDDVKLKNKRLMVVMQAVLAEELKDELKKYTHRGDATFLCQTPLLKGVNDQPDKLVALWRKLIQFGIMPYYVFHCRPVKGNEKYVIPLGRGYRMFQEAQNQCSGTTKRARYVMSSSMGKLEIVGREGSDVILKVHQARNKKDLGKIIKYPADKLWFN